MRRSLLLSALFLFSFHARADEQPARPPVVMTDQGRAVHSAGFVFDGHNDLLWMIRTEGGSSFDVLDIARPQEKLNTDIPRLRAGNVGAQFWSVYVPAETAREGTALQQTLEQIELAHAMIARYKDIFEMASTADDVVRIQQAGKIACMLGVEGGHSIENSLGVLRQFYDRGVRYMTITHSDSLAWADSATDEGRSDGLSAFGEAVIEEMNRLGMLVDLSHVAESTMLDALRVSRAPVIFSHSSARAIADHPRNVSDDVLRLTAEKGGVVMVNFYSGFVVPESARRRAEMFKVGRAMRQKFPKYDDYDAAMKQWRAAHPIDAGTIHDVVAHIDHIAQVAGVDHVGLGSDYDGVEKLPVQLEDVSTYPLITQALLDRGYKPDEIQKINSGNILRVLREAERVAANWK